MIKQTLTIFALLLVASPVDARSFTTTATHYGNSFVGRKMANGKVYYHGGAFIAHPTIKLGKKVTVCHKKYCVTGTVTDRCRCTIDLSKGLFQGLAPLRKGRINVTVFH